jgi:WD40 repeat protein
MQPVVATKLHKSVVNALEILPGTFSDPLLASAGSDFTINLTPLPTSSSTPQALTLTPLLSLKGHLRPVTALLPLRTDSLLSASADGSLRIWDTRSGTQQAMWTMPKPAVALAATAANDASGGAWVALADGNVRLVDTRVSTTSAAKWAAGVAARAIASSSDGREIGSWGCRRHSRAFDVRGGTVRGQWRRGGGPVECVSFAPDGRVVVGGEDGLPYVVDFTRGVDRPELHVSELVFGNVEDVEGVRPSASRES